MNNDYVDPTIEENKKMAKSVQSQIDDIQAKLTELKKECSPYEEDYAALFQAETNLATSYALCKSSAENLGTMVVILFQLSEKFKNYTIPKMDKVIEIPLQDISNMNNRLIDSLTTQMNNTMVKMQKIDEQKKFCANKIEEYQYKINGLEGTINDLKWQQIYYS